MPSGYSSFHQGGQGSKNNSIPYDELKAGFKCYLNPFNIERIIFNKEDGVLFIEFICPKCSELVSWLPKDYSGESGYLMKRKIEAKYKVKKNSKCSCNSRWTIELVANSFR